MKKTTGKIYTRDLSPPSNLTIRNPKYSRTTLCPSIENYDPVLSNSLQTSKHKDTVYFTLDPQQRNNLSSQQHCSQTYNEESLDCLPVNKYVKMPRINDSFSSSNCFDNYSEEQLSGDSLAIYENPVTKNREIVRKLGLMNSIFK